MNAMEPALGGNFYVEWVRSTQTQQKPTESIETVDVRSVVGLDVALNASDKTSPSEHNSESDDAARRCSKREADLTLSAIFQFRSKLPSGLSFSKGNLFDWRFFSDRECRASS